MYTAPAVISSPQSVTVSVASAASPSATASAILQLNPLVTVSLSPGGVTLQPSGSQQFAANVQGTTNTAVTWSIRPNVGSISSTGLYTAPASVPSGQTITVTAQSVQDKTKSATAQVNISTGVTFNMGPVGLTSLNWNGQSLLYTGVTTPSFAQMYEVNSAGTAAGLSTTPSKTVTSTQTNTVTQTYAWGTAATQYQALGNKLLITVTLHNSTAQTLNRYWMFPLAVKFPSTPVSFANNMAYNVDAPSSIWWNYTTGTVDLVNEDVTTPLGLGFWQEQNPAGSEWAVSLSVDPNSNVNPNSPGINRPIPPGGTNTISVSLRFGGPNATEMQLAGDIYSLFATTYPRKFTAPAVRRPMARLSFTGAFRPTFATNPRGWFNDPTVNVTTPAGVAAFQARLLAAADIAINEMKRVGASGGIIWDIEGQQLDQSYIGDPSQAETLAPELVGVMNAFVAKFTSAGYPIGFTLRPQVFSEQTGFVNVSGTLVTWAGGSQFSAAWAGQQAGGEITIGNNNYFIASVQSPTALTLTASAGSARGVPYIYGLQTNTSNPFAVLQSKVQYAATRWGASLFYVDSDLAYGGVNITPAQAFNQLTQQFPGTEFYPEWKNTEHYAYTYPFLDSVNGITAPPATVTDTYPQAAGLVRVPGDGQIAASQTALINSVSTGNILLFDGWYQHSANDVVMQIYQMAP